MSTSGLARYRRALAAVAAPIVLANLPFWVLAYWLHLDRGVFSMDGAAAICVATVNWFVGLSLLLVSWAADLLVSQSLTYHFTNPADFVRGARFAHDISVGDLVGWQLPSIGLLFACAALGVRWMLRRNPPRVGSVVGAILVMLALDAFNGSSALSNVDTRRTRVNLAGSPVTTLAKQWSSSTAAELSPLGRGESIGTEADVEQWAIENPTGSVLLVVVESMGLAKSPDVQAWLSAQLFDEALAQRFTARNLELPVRGATTAGELRALCAYRGSYGALSAEAGGRCLPSRLLKQGWATVGYHGFSHRMFDRARWWPHLGLQRRVFLGDMGPEMPHCGGAFRGACDGDVLARAALDLRQPKTFVYVLTLNTHLPIEPVEVPATLRPLCAASKMPDSACMLTAALGRTLRQVRMVLSSIERPLLAVVVGDHPPPFQTVQARNQFDAERVPAFVLSTRSR